MATHRHDNPTSQPVKSATRWPNSSLPGRHFPAESAQDRASVADFATGQIAKITPRRLRITPFNRRKFRPPRSYRAARRARAASGLDARIPCK